jgi:hypothetical protein
MSLDEKRRLRHDLTVALERANEASRELTRARESSDGARIRLAMTTYSAAEDSIKKLQRRLAELDHGLA